MDFFKEVYSFYDGITKEPMSLPEMVDEETLFVYWDDTGSTFVSRGQSETCNALSSKMEFQEDNLLVLITNKEIVYRKNCVVVIVHGVLTSRGSDVRHHLMQSFIFKSNTNELGLPTGPPGFDVTLKFTLCSSSLSLFGRRQTPTTTFRSVPRAQQFDSIFSTVPELDFSPCPCSQCQLIQEVPAILHPKWSGHEEMDGLNDDTSSNQDDCNRSLNFSQLFSSEVDVKFKEEKQNRPLSSDDVPVPIPAFYQSSHEEISQERADQTIYVGGITRVNSTDRRPFLKAAFGSFGPIKSIRLLENPAQEVYAFVWFESKESVDKVVKLSGGTHKLLFRGIVMHVDRYRKRNVRDQEDEKPTFVMRYFEL